MVEASPLLRAKRARFCERSEAAALHYIFIHSSINTARVRPPITFGKDRSGERDLCHIERRLQAVSLRPGEPCM